MLQKSSDGFRIIQNVLVYDHQPDEKGKVNPKSRQVQEELFHLAPATAAELEEFLQEQEAFLKEMAQEDERDAERAREQAFSILFQACRRVEADDVDLNSRTLPWSRHSEPVTLVCDDPPNRGTVTLTEDGWFWQACIERPGRLKQWNTPLMWVEDALKRMEQELLAARAQSECSNANSQKTSDRASVDPTPEIDLTPYRIDPADLEPERVTYRTVIEVEHIPTEFETIELSFGETIRCDEHFPSPSQLACELDLDLAKVRIEQLGGAYGFYEILSVATTDQKDVAAARAQQLWNGSSVPEMFKAGKVTRARFGYEETETNFSTWLGSLQDPERPWREEDGRDGYLADVAQRETLIHALDVKGYREHAHISFTTFSDEQLLLLLHEWRAISKYIRDAARKASETWLREHDDMRFREKAQD